MQNENNVNPNENENEEVGAEDYVSAIEKLKAGTVSKEEYEKLKKENKTLLNAVLNNQPSPEQRQEKKSVDDLKAQYKTLKEELSQAQDKNLSNLEYVDKALKLRKTAMDLGLQDPFVPNSPMGPDDNDFNTAEKVAKVLQECVDEANGNPATFRNLFEQAVRDDSKIPLNKNTKRR